ncbi:hypothetical protein [Pararhizobium sp. DWP3-4]|uniref:hypothetical protein n=1 Tax=Pararhizobium sp. DWP3-4 TaxID=2804565 RepID=UPI003CF54F32
MVGNFSEDVRERLEDFVDTFVVKGAKAGDVLDAIMEQAAVLRDAYERDPDPAEDASADVVGEPSNDWPAADQDKPRTSDS